MLTTLTTLAGLVLLFLGGDMLVRGASALALRVGISPLAVGLTVVALGTSAPELVVSLDAALSGADDIALGNVVGSNIANAGLVVGVAALLTPLCVDAKVVRLDAPIMVVAALGLAGAMADMRISRGEGVLLLSALVAYMGFTLWEARRDTEHAREVFASAAGPPGLGVAKDLVLVVAGIASLVAGGHLLVTGAVEIAASLGVGQAVIGLTVVAVGTSLPELATSIVASFKGQSDIAVGNVVGSNIFNIFGTVGVTSIVQPLSAGGLTNVDLAMMLGLSAALPVLLFTRLEVSRAEGGLLLAAYLGYMGFLFVGAV